MNRRNFIKQSSLLLSIPFLPNIIKTNSIPFITSVIEENIITSFICQKNSITGNTLFNKLRNSFTNCEIVLVSGNDIKYLDDFNKKLQKNRMEEKKTILFAEKKSNLDLHEHSMTYRFSDIVFDLNVNELNLIHDRHTKEGRKIQLICSGEIIRTTPDYCYYSNIKEG